MLTKFQVALTPGHATFLADVLIVLSRMYLNPCASEIFYQLSLLNF